MTMHQPMGRVLALQYREKSIHVGDGRFQSIDAVRVSFRTPDGSIDSHDLPNGRWAVENAALQFMAVYGFQPTDLDTMTNVEDERLLIPLNYDSVEETWHIAQSALSAGEAQLEASEWFDPSPFEEPLEQPHSANMDGDGPDPSAGSRGGVEEPSEHEQESGVSMELAPADSDSGVNVHVGGS